MKRSQLQELIKEMIQIIPEEKSKGTNGKACWDGYRYAGTKNGKDVCVKTGKGKTKNELNEGKADYSYIVQAILDAKPKHNVYYNSGHNKVNIGGVGYDGGDLVQAFNQKPGSSSKLKNNFYYANEDPETTKAEVERLSNGKITVDIQKGYAGKPMAVFTLN